MKKRRYGTLQNQRSAQGTFRTRLLVCVLLAALAFALRRLGPHEFYDALLYRLDAGPGLNDLIEAFGQAPVSTQALEKLWHDGVIEVLRFPA